MKSHIRLSKIYEKIKFLSLFYIRIPELSSEYNSLHQILKSMLNFDVGERVTLEDLKV